MEYGAGFPNIKHFFFEAESLDKPGRKIFEIYLHKAE